MKAVVTAALAASLAASGTAARSSPPTERTLLLEHLATITEHAWAAGSEAKLFLHGSKLYVPLGGRGLAIYDLSDPRLPLLRAVAGRDVLGGQGGAVVASGDRAYVSLADQEAIVVLDVSEPSAPRWLARFASIPDINQLALRGRHLFVSAGSSFAYLGGVYVFDVSVTPPAPAGRYLTNLIDPGFHVSPSGTVFLARTPATAGDAPKLEVIDMSVPASPRLVGRWSSPYPGNIVDIDLRQGRLYCAAYWGGLWVLNAADPARLRLVARFDWEQMAAYAAGGQAAPPYVFLARGGPDPSYRGFQVFHMMRASVSPMREIPATLPVHSVYRSGNLLILAQLEPPFVLNPRMILDLYQVFERKGP